MSQVNDDVVRSSLRAHWLTFLITWLFFCLVSLAGFFWGENPHDPGWFIFAVIVGPVFGFTGCLLKDM